MRIIDWPGVLVPRDYTIRPPRKTVGLTTSLSQFTQASPAIRPPFGMTLEFDALTDGELLAWRAMLGALEGRTNALRVPLFDIWLAASAAAIGAGSETFSDGSEFSDGAHWLTTDLSGVTVTALQGAKTITADFGDYGQIFEAGQYFGLGDCPYIANSVTWEGSVATIGFTASLRRDCTDEPLRLRPVMIAGLTSDDGGELPLKRGRWSLPTLDLEERFDEPFS